MEAGDSGPAAAPIDVSAERSNFAMDLMEEIISGNYNFNYWLDSAAETSSSASPFRSSALSPLFDLGDNPDLYPDTDSPIDNIQFSELQEPSPSSQCNWLIHSGNGSTLASVKERLSCALRHIKESQKDGEVLVQIWVPVDKDGKSVLTTCGQPFWLDSNCQRLISYRSVSMNYQFSAEIDSSEALGLPGRVFVGKVPEWSPDVRYFSRDEYQRVGHAQHYDVRGTIALPIFDKPTGSCLGVVEVVRTTQKINYSADLETICDVLQAVDLRSSDIHSVPLIKMRDDSYQAALPEIRRVLQVVCGTHKLPLAQTWMPCFQQGKRGSRHSEENYRDCVSTVDDACHVRDASMLGFHRACSEHHLLRGEGVAGKAFTTNQPCFSPDITSFSKTSYPLSHHARMFDLRAAVAIRLRGIHTGNADFVLELFLPINCIGDEEQRVMLNSLSITIQEVCQNLRVCTTKELEDEAKLQENQISNIVLDKSWIPDMVEQQMETSTLLPSSYIPELQTQEELLCSRNASEVKRSYDELMDSVSDHKDSVTCESGFFSAGKGAEKRRTKTEKTIRLQVLRQYFAGSLKDAAKSLGVCPTTLKRICRQHGITRWPSRKIKKVGHSLKKLQVVIDSVHGAEGAFQFNSLYENFTKASGTSNLLIGSSNMSALKQDVLVDVSNLQQQHEARASSHTSVSNSMSSSCSQNSNSSHCYSSGTKLSPKAIRPIIKEDNRMEADQGRLLKKVCSHSELPLPVPEAPKSLMRSQSVEFVRGESGSMYPPNKSRSGVMRVKAIFGEEKVRFRLQPTWTFCHLRQEIAKRFNIGKMDSMDLKYLDDDSEWVLLTCDADLQECIEVYASSGAQTIKITVEHAAPRNSGYSLDRTGLW